MVKECYKETIERVSRKLGEYKDCFRFAVIADTHLDNSTEDTIENIKAQDAASGFSCLVHLGDFLNGNIPKEYSQKILDGQMQLFRRSIDREVFLPVQGNHDGYCDMISGVANIAEDENWYHSTSFVDECANISRPDGKPYYFMDFPEEKIRFVVLCTFYNIKSPCEPGYEKIYGTDLQQIKWLGDEALSVDEDWTVLLFSHDVPFEKFDKTAFEDNPRANGNLLMDTVNSARRKNGFTLAAWFIGHFHGDYIGNVGGIDFILVGSQTAYVPQLWPMPEGGYYPERKLNSSSEDLWDAVVIDKAARKIRLFRFGAGADRELDY